MSYAKFHFALHSGQPLRLLHLALFVAIFIGSSVERNGNHVLAREIGQRVDRFDPGAFHVGHEAVHLRDEKVVRDVSSAVNTFAATDSHRAR